MNRFLIRKYIIKYYNYIDTKTKDELAKNKEFKKVTSYISNVLKSKLSSEERKYIYSNIGFFYYSKKRVFFGKKMKKVGLIVKKQQLIY